MPFLPSDVLRLAAVVSVVVASAVHGWLGFALFLLVLGGVFVPRALGSPGWLDATYCTTLLVGAWAAQLDWYVTVPGLDVAVHAVATGLIGAVAWQVLVRLGAFPEPGAGGPEGLPGARRPRLGAFVITAAVAVALAALWEIGEWIGHTWLDDRIQVGYDDTVTDLAAGVLGAGVAGAVVARTAGRR